MTCIEALSAAQEVVEALRAKGLDYSAHVQVIAEQLFDYGLLEGNDEASTDLGDPILKDLRAIQEDHYDQHMDESEQPGWDDQLCYVCAVPSYIWFSQ